MQRYKNLLFFNKSGYPTNFEYDTELECWKGSIFFPKVSIGLYESEHLFICEKFSVNNTILYGMPHLHNSYSTINTLTCDWTTFDNENIIMFQYDKTNQQPELEVLQTLDIALQKDINETIINDSIKTSNNIIKNCIQLNFAINSDTEGEFYRVLNIKDNDSGKNIAEIIFYGETVEEDERLKTLCADLDKNYKITNSDLKIFRDADINEQNIDYILLNTKRKEMLIEGHNISPFTSTYKGLINIIKFFGYDNLKVKEYWKNVDITSPRYGKYKHTNVIDIFSSEINLNDPYSNPDKTYRKTNSLGLFYKINNVKEGYYDAYDLPVTEEIYEFSLEESLIKLFGLKEKLRKEFLPPNSRIVDIVGEADYFTKINTRFNFITNTTLNLDIGIQPHFKISPNSIGYIQDLRSINLLIDPAYTPYNLDRDMRIGDTTHTLSQIEDVIAGYFSNYNIKDISRLPDNIDIPVGYPIILENTSFDLVWDDADVIWDKLVTDKNHIYEFYPNNGFNNDKFTILEQVSNETVEFVCTSTLYSNLDIVNGLYNAWLSKYTIQDSPWGFFVPKIINGVYGPGLRIYGVGVASATLRFNWKTIVEQGGGANDQTFDYHVVTQSGLYVWDSILRGNFYDIEWEIWKDKTETPAYSNIIRGSIDEYDKVYLSLPYAGIYSIILRLYDTYNQVSSYTSMNVITVESKEANFIGFYKWMEESYYWDMFNDVNWDIMGSSWDLPLKKTSDVDDIEVAYYEALTKANSLPNKSTDLNFNLQAFRNDDSINETGPYYWNNLLEGTWNDVTNIWWDATNVTGDAPASFRINSVYKNESILIEDIRGKSAVHTFKCYDLNAAVIELRNDKNELFSRYTYNLISDTNDNPQFIQVVARFFGKSYDIKNITIKGTRSFYSNISNSKNNDITYNELNVLKNYRKFKPLQHISFSYDNCKIAGKNKARWIIENTTTEDIKYYDNKYLNYLFKDKGKYRIGLEIEDTNGNKSITKRNLVIIE